jgi:hypothetical protein
MRRRVRKQFALASSGKTPLESWVFRKCPREKFQGEPARIASAMRAVPTDSVFSQTVTRFVAIPMLREVRRTDVEPTAINKQEASRAQT